LTSADNNQTQIHGTCVEIGGHGVLLTGNSGAGKSDLALRLIDQGAVLVADDRVDLFLDKGTLFASPPDILSGMLEVRGIGIVTLPHTNRAPVSIVIDLVKSEAIERLPETTTLDLLKISLPFFTLAPFEQSSLQKVHLALQIVHGDIVVAD